MNSEETALSISTFDEILNRRRLLMRKRMSLAVWTAIVGSICAGLWLSTKQGYRIERVVDFNSLPPEASSTNFPSPVMVDGKSVMFQLATGPIFRISGGDIQQIPRLGEQKFRRPRGFVDGPSRSLFVMLADKCYYIAPDSRQLICYENGVETPLLNIDISRISHLAGDNETLAFATREAGVFRVRNGAADNVNLPPNWHPTSIDQLFVDGERIFIKTFDDAIFVADDEGTAKFIANGDSVPNGTLSRIRRMSSAAGTVAFSAWLSGGSNTRSALYVKKDGKISTVGTDPFPDDSTDTYFHVCTNGDSVAALENRSDRKPKLGKFEDRSNAFPDATLAVYRDGARHVVTEIGDTLQGAVICRITIGPQSMDAKGNLAFGYYLDDESRGIATAKPDRMYATYASLLFVAAALGFVFQLFRRRQKSLPSRESVSPSNRVG